MQTKVRWVELQSGLCQLVLGRFSENPFSETPTPTTCLKSTAVHLQFVRQYAPHLYRRTFLELSFEERETLQYASHLYCSTPPICTAVRPPFVRQYFWKNTGGWGHRNEFGNNILSLGALISVSRELRLNFYASFKAHTFFGGVFPKHNLRKYTIIFEAKIQPQIDSIGFYSHRQS